METRIIEGHFNYSKHSLYRPCYLCNIITSNFYHTTQTEDKNIRYRVYLCEYCRNFKNKVNPKMYAISIQNYIRSKWKDTNIQEYEPLEDFVKS